MTTCPDTRQARQEVNTKHNRQQDQEIWAREKGSTKFPRTKAVNDVLADRRQAAKRVWDLSRMYTEACEVEIRRKAEQGMVTESDWNVICADWNFPEMTAMREEPLA